MKIAFILYCCFFITFICYSQNVGINTTTPHASSTLDINSTDKGILIPRMTLSQRNAIPLPAQGLMIYQTDNTPGFYYFNNLGNWIRITNTNDNFSLPYSATSSFGQEAFKVTHNNAINGVAINGNTTNSTNGIGVLGTTDISGLIGVKGISSNQSGYGIVAENDGGGMALYVNSNSSPTYPTARIDNFGGGTAFRAATTSSSSTASAIFGSNNGTAGFGVRGVSNASNTAGVRGESTDGVAVSGFSATSIALSGVSTSGTALTGISSNGLALSTSGNVKMSGGNMTPKAGAILTSVDAAGNAVWKENNVAFKAYGMNSSYNSIPPAINTKVHFGGEKFDLGNDYQLLPSNTSPLANSSTFIAPVNGIYHFNISLDFSTDPNELPYAALKLFLNRNGNLSELATSVGVVQSVGLEEKKHLFLSVNESLLANDMVYVAIWHNSDVNGDIAYGVGTWFSGHLVKAQ